MSFGYVEILLLVSGLATCSAILQFIAPRKFTATLFDIEATPATMMLSRHWALLSFLIGSFLISAIFNPSWVLPAMLIAGIEKGFFASFLLFTRQPMNAARWGFALSDYLFVALFAHWLYSQHTPLW